MCVHASVPVQVRIMGILMVHGRVPEGIRWCCVDPCAIGACTVPRTDHASQCVAHCDPLFVLLSGSALELALFSPITRVE